MRHLIALILACLPGLTIAQDREGNDTPGDWRVDFVDPHGLWTAFCDWREENGAPHKRCYIRYVDVFSPRPDFAAMFLFVTPEPDGSMVDFGIEAGTLFDPDGFRIVRDGETTWSTRFPGCLTGLSCGFRGGDGAELLQDMRAGGAFRFTFTDRHGAPRDLTWSLDGFDAAWTAFAEQARMRDLM